MTSQISSVAGGRVLVGDRFVPGDVRIADGRVVAVDTSSAGVASPGGIDAKGMLVTPGLIDIHIHGARSHGFADGDEAGLSEIGRYLLAEGVTSCVASLASASVADLEASLRRLDEHPSSPDEALVLGVHLEGPFLAPAQRGAHAQEALRAPTDADRALMARWRHLIRMVTLAPEIDGALALTAELSREGIVAAVGHSDAPGAALSEMRRAGSTHITHLWSGQSLLRRSGPWRVPGLLEASLASSGMTAEIIADGRHLPPELLEIARRCLGADLVVVSDATAGTGMPEGHRYRLGEVLCEVRGGVGVVVGQDSFGGSTTALPDMVRHLIQVLGWDPAEVFRMATESPARAIGVSSDRGRVAPGLAADLVVWDDELRPVHVIRGGRLVR